MIDYSKTSLFDLNKKCSIGDNDALDEWKRRWEAEWPNVDTPKIVKRKED